VLDVVGFDRTIGFTIVSCSYISTQQILEIQAKLKAKIDANQMKMAINLKEMGFDGKRD
jgi:hypothetical protein